MYDISSLDRLARETLNFRSIYLRRGIYGMLSFPSLPISLSSPLCNTHVRGLTNRGGVNKSVRQASK